MLSPDATPAAGSHNDRLWAAIRRWMIALDDFPGWTEWKRKQLGHTLLFDDPFGAEGSEKLEDFTFSPEVEMQHAVLTQYMSLVSTAESLKGCEYYFRRYPFRGLPITRKEHLTNICEMYFGRFYEFRERLKKFINSVNAVMPPGKRIDGRVIKQFSKIFDQEIRARHSVHHHERYQDIELDRLFLAQMLANSEKAPAPEWKRRQLAHYRELSRTWSQRVREQGAKLDRVVEVIAEFLLENCEFLVEPKSIDKSSLDG